jgi:hypothetical protein
MCCFEVGDEDLGVESTFDFGGIGTFKKEFDSLFQIRRGCFNGLTLTGNVEFWTERNVACAFLLNNRGITSHRHVFFSLVLSKNC